MELFPLFATFAPRMKNYLGQTLVLLLLFLFLLIGLAFVPENFTVAGHSLRRMDIFADVRRPVKEGAPIPGEDEIAAQEDSLQPAGLELTDTLALADSLRTARPLAPLPPVDTGYFGNVIEDYTFDRSGLSRFFAAVDSTRAGRTVRVAWYGDSFVEGDILIGDLRDSLQSLWGGNGVGFVPMTSEVAQFKRTLKHVFRGWTSYSIVKKGEHRPAFGIDGHAYRPGPEAKAHYEGADYFRHTRSWSQVRLFYSTSQKLPFVWQNEGMEPQMADLLPRPEGQISQWKWSSPGIRGFALRFPDTNGLLLYGASLEDGPGFYIDNFSVRSNSGGPLRLIRPDVVRQFEAYQHYDLVVVQVGMNAVTNSTTNVKWYQAELDRVFEHLRVCFPHKPILVVSVGDRANKVDGELATMRGVPAIVAMQRDLARKHGFLFYDLFHGMGGYGAMIRLANHKPMLANKDYTHLTHEGGRVVGRMFVRLFAAEQAKWRQQKIE